MTDNGRIIINARGETLQVLLLAAPSRRHAVTLQVSVLNDAITVLSNGSWVNELALGKEDAIAAALKLLDAVGMACELRPNRKAPAR